MLESYADASTHRCRFDECFPNDRIRAQLENLLPLDATSWDDQLEAIVALAKRNDIAAIVPTPENYATYLCAMYTRKLLLRNVERIRINSSGGGIYLAFRAVYLPAAIILTAYYDFHTKPNGFFATLLDSPLARPMRAELREEYGSLFELSITQGYAKDRSTFFQITSRGVPAVRPFGNPALTSYQKDLMPVLFDDTEQLTFFTAFRDYLQGLLSGYDAEDWEAETSICEILVMRTRDECLSFYKTNKNKLKLAASQAAGRGVGLGSSEASTQSTARGDTTSSGVSKRLATQTTAPLPPSDRDTRPMPTVQHAMALVNLGANSWTPAQISSSAPPISSGVTARAPITDVPSSSNSQGDANERARASVTGAAGLRQYVPPPPLRPSNTTAAFGSKSQGNADERARASAVGAVGLHQYVPPQPLCLSNTSAATGLRSQGDANERARASVTGAAILQQYVPPPPLHPIDTSSEGQGPSTSEGKSPRLPPKEEANRMRARVEFYQEKVIETQEAVKKAREETTDALEDDEKPQIAREDAAEARVKLRNKEWSEEQYLKGLKDSQQES